MPTSTEIWTGVGNYSSQTFTEFLPLVYIVVGFILGGILISFLVRAIMGGIKRATKSGGKGRRKR